MIDTADYWRQAQQALTKGNSELAAVCLEKAVDANPADLEAYRALGRIFRITGKTNEAVACYRRCLEVARNDGVATMGLAALGKAPIPPRLPEDVVLYVFDRNAESYEANMRSLGYGAPETLLELLRAEVGAADGSLDVLDLGCGSGLCGPPLRPFARRLVGVDLSPRMLAIADAKHVYNELIQNDILEYLARATGGFDVAVAANVLCYFGNLVPVVQGISRILHPGGHFLFDVEKGQDLEPTFHVSGRFTHSLALLEQIFVRHGFSFSRVYEDVMRSERGAPVTGLFCAARRNG